MTYRRMLLMALLAVMVALAIVLGTLLALSRWAAMPSVTYFVYYEGIVANQEIYFYERCPDGPGGHARHVGWEAERVGGPITHNRRLYVQVQMVV